MHLVGFIIRMVVYAQSSKVVPVTCDCNFHYFASNLNNLDTVNIPSVCNTPCSGTFYHCSHFLWFSLCHYKQMLGFYVKLDTHLKCVCLFNYAAVAVNI